MPYQPRTSPAPDVSNPNSNHTSNTPMASRAAAGPGNRSIDNGSGDRAPGTARIAYDDSRAHRYRKHHRKNIRVRFSTWRERHLVSTALERLPAMHSILDLATGTGRFWPVAEAHADYVLAMDNSLAMLKAAGLKQRKTPSRVAADAFRLPLRDAAIDCVLCMRFLHHFYHPEDRLRVLSELRRVARTGVVVSVWTDTRYGFLRAGKKRLELQSHSSFPKGFGPRICIPSGVLESEYLESGFCIRGYQDFLAGRSLWRVYALATA